MGIILMRNGYINESRGESKEGRQSRELVPDGNHCGFTICRGCFNLACPSHKYIT